MMRVRRQLMNRSAFTQHINHTIGSELSGTAYERLFLIYQLIHGAESGRWRVLRVRGRGTCLEGEAGGNKLDAQARGSRAFGAICLTGAA